MNKRIVVVEDDPDILAMMQFILTEEGYEVICYTQPESVTELTKHHPSLILLDNRLPTRNGNTFCAQIKADPATKDIPVILVSASANLGQLADKCNADAFLSKPFNLDELIALVNLYISNTPSLA